VILLLSCKYGRAIYCRLQFLWEHVEAGGEALEAIPPIADPYRYAIDQDRLASSF